MSRAELAAEAAETRRRAREVKSAEEVDRAIARMAGEVGARMGGADPLVLAVMSGGVFTAAGLCRHFDFPYAFDYVHLTRYRDRLEGGRIEWRVPLPASVTGRSVVVVDDVVDHGVTLAALRRELDARGVAELRTAVLVRKAVATAQPRPHVDVVGIRRRVPVRLRHGLQGLLARAPRALRGAGTLSEPVGLIVGSGFRRLGLALERRPAVETPYGAPSSPLLGLTLGAHGWLCIARHGETHAIAPHEVNYRANVWALQAAGVRRVIGVNVVGAIDPELSPGGFAVPEQLVDYTTGRASTFGPGPDGAVRHVDFTEPFDPVLRGALVEALVACRMPVRGGTYAVTQGPRLETAAEIERLKRDGCTLVGMTAMPEAVLARELGLGYASLALAVNHAAGLHPEAAPILAEIESHLEQGMRAVVRVLEQIRL